jgi:hypothetical protein
VSIEEEVDVKPRPTFQSSGRHTNVTAQDLSERWCISLHQAAETLKKTTQRIIRSAILPLGGGIEPTACSSFQDLVEIGIRTPWMEE